jgi:hypothetical protein
MMSISAVPVDLFSQKVETCRAFAYDRGLINTLEPFAPSGNPALLAFTNTSRLNVEFYKTDDNDYSISLVYPLSSITGLGMLYSSKNQDDVFHLSHGIFETVNRNQLVVLSLGHNYIFQFGQQLELNFNLNRYSVVQATNDRDFPFDNDQRMRFSYRLGFFKNVKNIALGFLSPPLLHYEYHSFSESNRAPESTWKFFQESEPETRRPLFALGWNYTAHWAFAVSNRSKYGHNDLQLAFEFKAGNLSLTQAIGKQNNTDKIKYIFGVGGYIKGFEVFSAMDVASRDVRIALSFAPERRKKLIDLDRIDIPQTIFYPYRLIHQTRHPLIKLSLKNLVEYPVDITINLSGYGLPSIAKSLVLNGGTKSLVDIPLPPRMAALQPGEYQYALEVLAFYRGRQSITRTIPFEIKSRQDWAGDPHDLVYFITPDDDVVMAKARECMTRSAPLENAAKIAECFYRFIQDSIRYVSDPAPLRQRQDRVQYPVDILKSKSGDCEDISILMISLLQSVGIDASFIEICDPSTNEGHVFVAFDCQQSFARLTSKNRNLQNYLKRISDTVSKPYIPLELTRHELSFAEAWQYAIEKYDFYAIEKNGLAEGWVNIIDINE